MLRRPAVGFDRVRMGGPRGLRSRRYLHGAVMAAPLAAVRGAEAAPADLFAHLHLQASVPHPLQEGQPARNHPANDSNENSVFYNMTKSKN